MRCAPLLALLLLAGCDEETSAPTPDAAADAGPEPDARPEPDAGPEPDARSEPDARPEPDARSDAAPDAACPPGSEPTPAGCLDTEPLPEPSGPRLGDTLCISSGVPGERDAFFAALADLGVAVLRRGLTWHRVERVQGTFDFTHPDAEIAAAEAHGVELLGMLAYGNPWASARGQAEQDPYYPPDDPADFARYAGAMAERYAGRVRRWEIWNEQNAGYRFWKHPPAVDGEPDRYGELLVATQAAIAAADPVAQVGFGGLFYLPQVIIGAEDFLEQAYAAVPELGAAFDALAYHPYAYYPPRHPPEFHGERVFNIDHYAVDETARRMRAIVEANEGRAKPLWVTELGWPSLDLSPETQARYITRAALLLWSEGVELYCVYTWQDSGERDVPWEGYFGLHDPEGTPKPAAQAFRTLAELFGSARFVRREAARYDLPAGVHLLGFAAGETYIRALWSEEGAVEVDLPDLPARSWVRRDQYGAEVGAVEARDGRLLVEATEAPIYLLGTPR